MAELPIISSLLFSLDEYRVRYQGRVVSWAVYNILAFDTDGKKELIGMYVSESERAKLCWVARTAECFN